MSQNYVLDPTREYVPKPTSVQLGELERCDRCGAQAPTVVPIVIPQDDGSTKIGELLLCKSDAEKHAQQLEERSRVVTDRLALAVA